MLIRLAQPNLPFTRSVVDAARSLSSDTLVSVTSLDTHVGEWLVRERVMALLSGFFGTLAVLLAGIGLSMV